MIPRLSLLGGALAAVLVAAAVATAAVHRIHVVATAKNAKLGTTVLVNVHGRTLYDLSVERHGKFICTDKTCLSFWHPLLVPANATPTGVSGLASVNRPDGTHQVTYHSAPLYTFAGDHARGDAKGEGLKDVGVWHAATVGKSPSPTTGGAGGYHY